MSRVITDRASIVLHDKQTRDTVSKRGGLHRQVQRSSYFDDPYRHTIRVGFAKRFLGPLFNLFTVHATSYEGTSPIFLMGSYGSSAVSEQSRERYFSSTG